MNFEILNTLFGALGGAALIKLADLLFMSKKDKRDAVMMFLTQLQAEVSRNDEKITALEKQVSVWRDKYYNELQEKNKVLDELRLVRLELKKFNEHNK